jgi:hypothetical protein
MNRLNIDDAKAFSVLLCRKLASDLDAEDESSINFVGHLLAELPLESFYFGFKTEIGIERVVRYSLDDHGIFCPIMSRVNKILENNTIYNSKPETREDIEKNIETIREHEQRKNSDITQPSEELANSPASTE